MKVATRRGFCRRQLFVPCEIRDSADQLDDGDHVSLCYRLEFRPGQGRKICGLDPDNTQRYGMVMLFQVGSEEIYCTAFAGAMSDQNNLIRRCKLTRNFVVKRFIFRHVLTLVVSLLAM